MGGRNAGVVEALALQSLPPQTQQSLLVFLGYYNQQFVQFSYKQNPNTTGADFLSSWTRIIILG